MKTALKILTTLWSRSNENVQQQAYRHFRHFMLREIRLRNKI